MAKKLSTDKPSADKPSGKPDWKQKLEDYAYQLLLLKVVTFVGGADVTVDVNGKVTSISIADDTEPFVTICDLVGGDVTNVVPDRLKGDAAMVEFHAAQVEKAAAVLPNNLKLLWEVIDKVV